MINERIESQLFTWTDCEEALNPEDCIFYNVELVVPLGIFPKGRKFKFCNYSPSIGIVEFFDSDTESGPECMFELKLSAI